MLLVFPIVRFPHFKIVCTFQNVCRQHVQQSVGYDSRSVNTSQYEAAIDSDPAVHAP